MTLDRAAIAKLRRRHTAGLVAVAVALTNEAKARNQHIDTGERRNSITHAVVDGDRSVVWGLPRNAKNVSLELGMKPHWVPIQHISVWADRHGVGIITVRVRTRGREVLNTGVRVGSRTVNRQFLAAGVLVGGPNSTLAMGPGQPGAYLFAGRGKRVFRRYATRGGRSKYLAPNTVGDPILQPTVRERLRVIALPAFARGFQRG